MAGERTDIRHIPEPELAMTPFIFPIGRAVLFVAGVFAAANALAGGARDVDHRPTNSFALVLPAQSPQTSVIVPSNGVAVPPSRPVVSNPYNVPLFQNAGSIRALR